MGRLQIVQKPVMLEHRRREMAGPDLLTDCRHLPDHAQANRRPAKTIRPRAERRPTCPERFAKIATSTYTASFEQKSQANKTEAGPDSSASLLHH